jgi:protein-disulfide isomerase
MPLRRHLPIIIAVAISALIIGIAYVVVQRDAAEEEAGETLTMPGEPGVEETPVPELQPGDHVFGNPNADILFYVYSDFGCPFCKEYHLTMKNIVNVYGSDGRVAWVWRHMPLVQLHPNSPMYALASECIAEEAGDAGFWKFADSIFETYDPLSPPGAADLVLLAEAAGASRTQFVACMQADRHMGHVEDEFDQAVAAGADGTPFTVIISSEQRIVLKGAQQFRTLAGAVQAVLRTIDAMDSGGMARPSSHSGNQSDLSAEFKAIPIGTTTQGVTSTPTAPPQQPASEPTPTPTLPPTPPSTSSTPSILDGIIDA